MKDLQLDDGGVPAEDRINRTVSWRGFLRLAALSPLAVPLPRWLVA